MKRPRLRFLLALALFLAWIGWLTYLVQATNSSLLQVAKPVVLSRPQFLVSSLDVLAEVAVIDRDPAEVAVHAVSWPKDKDAEDLVGKKIFVSHLPECRDDWTGPGEYILPLMRFGEKGYQIVPIPRSPGFPYSRPRIYPSTPQTREQLQAIDKAHALRIVE
jgi:hypothetical protein